MKQSDGPPKGTWTGSALGGVKAPDPRILPDPAARFARIAARLEVLSAGHPMASWLHFIAGLATAQQTAADTMPPVAGPTLPAVEQAVAARMPPIAADGHRRDPVWRDGLFVLLDGLHSPAIPRPARAVMAALRDRDPDALEALADGFLRGGVDAADVGAALYVAAALQVYFTHLAATLPSASLRLLPQRGLCPCCGSTPVAGVVTEAGRSSGTRYLYCSLCGTAWNHVRTVCITCGQSRSVVLRAIEGYSAAVRAETCDECHTYAKMLYQAQDVNVDPFADDLATLALDMLVARAGWSRHAPNPLLLIGPGGTR